jgi:hypothetical protein
MEKRGRMGAKPSKKPCRFAAPFSRSPKKRMKENGTGKMDGIARREKEIDGHWASAFMYMHIRPFQFQIARFSVPKSAAAPQ